MKVAIFTDSFLPQVSGVTKVLEEQLRYFDAHNIEYMVFAPRYSRVDDSGFKGRIIRLKSMSFIFYKECRVSVPNYMRVKELLRDFNPDIIHIITPFTIGLCGLLCGKQMDIPMVTTYHTNYAQYMRYYYANFIGMGLWDYIKWFHNKCQLSLCPSQETKNELLRHGIYNVEVCPNGIHPEIFSPDKRNESLREKYGLKDKVGLLYVGRISREKNMNLLVDAMNILNRQYKDSIKLIMAGNGPYLEHIKRVMPDNVVYTGYIFGEELSEVYASADVFVFPSLTETFGNVVLEAMSSGLPVVAVAAGGVKDNVENGYNGFLVHANNAQKFASAVCRLIEDEYMRKRMSYNARQYALTLTWDLVFETLLQAYESVLKQPEDGTVVLI